jgi:nucleoside recognition membrane protein YjiH
LIAFNTKIFRWGVHGTFLEGIMVGVGKATSSRSDSERVAYFFGDGRLGITKTGRFEHR